MKTKSILLAYASRFGSTQEVAETIASTLSEAGLEVNLQPMQDIKSLDRYDAVVLGAAIYNAKWNADAHQFVSQHQDALTQLPVAIFTLGPLSPSDAAKRNSRRQLDNELAKYPSLKPVAVEVFVGKLDPTKLGFFERLGTTASDHRNWDAIRAWANTLPTLLERVGVLRPI
jgi:menaquinone-dependent protoporphyrinogen oxidase